MTTYFKVDIEENISDEKAQKLLSDLEEVIGKSDYSLEYSDYEVDEDEEEE